MTSSQTTPMLRSQHGPAISPAPPDVVAAVGATLSRLAATGPGGESFTTPDVSESAVARRFAAAGRLWPVEGARVHRDAEWQGCHEIAARIVIGEPERYAAVFGWARDGGDRHWRTHSWVWDRRAGRIIEPTPGLRSAYAGVELTFEELIAFDGEPVD